MGVFRMRPSFSQVPKSGTGNIFHQMKQITLNIQPREQMGTIASKSLRKSGLVPAIIYGDSGLRHLAVDAHEFAMQYRKISGTAALFELKMEGEDPMFAIIQELQRNTRTDAFLHIDFKEIVRGKDMEADIPVHTIGTADGVRNYGGVLEISSHTLRVRCRPRHLPEEILINVSKLGIGDSLHLSDLEAPEGVTFLDDPHQVVVGCVGASSGASAAADDEGDEADDIESGEEAVAAETES